MFVKNKEMCSRYYFLQDIRIWDFILLIIYSLNIYETFFFLSVIIMCKIQTWYIRNPGVSAQLLRKGNKCKKMTHKGEWGTLHKIHRKWLRKACFSPIWKQREYPRGERRIHGNWGKSGDREISDLQSDPSAFWNSSQYNTFWSTGLTLPKQH